MKSDGRFQFFLKCLDIICLPISRVKGDPGMHVGNCRLRHPVFRYGCFAKEHNWEACTVVIESAILIQFVTIIYEFEKQSFAPWTILRLLNNRSGDIHIIGHPWKGEKWILLIIVCALLNERAVWTTFFVGVYKILGRYWVHGSKREWRS